MAAGKESESGELDDNVEMHVPNPVKVEKLPAGLKEPRMNLDVVPESTRDNDYARLLRALQQERRKQALAATGGKSPPPAVSIQLDPLNLITSSGINQEHTQGVPKLVFMEPIAKVLKPEYGVGYKDPKATLQGEPYETKADEINHMTRSKFNEIS